MLRPLIDTGKVKVLGTTGATRMAALPDAPTVLEAGYLDAVNIQDLSGIGVEPLSGT